MGYIIGFEKLREIPYTHGVSLETKTWQMSKASRWYAWETVEYPAIHTSIMEKSKLWIQPNRKGKQSLMSLDMFWNYSVNPKADKEVMIISTGFGKELVNCAARGQNMCKICRPWIW